MIPTEVLEEAKKHSLDSAKLLTVKDGVKYYDCFIDTDMPTGLPNICKFENGKVTWLSDRAALELIKNL